MKIVKEVKLINCGKFARSSEWEKARRKLHTAIKKVEWPKGSGKFTIHPESGKKRGMGNGVLPIKLGLMLDLEKQGYRLEAVATLGDKRRFGRFDAVLDTSCGPAVVEWETGNISSSHRSLNKMALGAPPFAIFEGWDLSYSDSHPIRVHPRQSAANTIKRPTHP